MGFTFLLSLVEALDFVDFLEAILEKKGEALVVAVSLGGDLHRVTLAEFFQKGGCVLRVIVFVMFEHVFSIRFLT